MSDAPQRFVAFVDDSEALERVREHFGPEDVVPISTRDLGPGVRRFRRATLERDIEGITELHRDRPFSAVIQWREQFVLVAARLAERLKLPFAMPDAMLARDKLAMKAALRPHVRCAASHLVRGASDLDVAAALFPGVLKPRFGFASICAVRVPNASVARREYVEKRDKLVTTHLEQVDLGIPEEPEFVLESFVGGSEHTVESFVADGEIVVQLVSDKQPMTPPYFVEAGDVLPSALGTQARAAVTAAASRAIAALGIRQGWTHAEIKLWRGEAWVMEIAARMGGGYTRELVQAVYGLDMLKAYFEHVTHGTRPALGEPNGVALGRRIIVSGLSVVCGTHSVERLAAQRRIVLVERESRRRNSRVVLGVPYSYEGTLAAYLVRARDRSELERVVVAIDPALAPRCIQIPIPRAVYRRYLSVKRVLDGLARRW